MSEGRGFRTRERKRTRAHGATRTISTATERILVANILRHQSAGSWSCNRERERMKTLMKTI